MAADQAFLEAPARRVDRLAFGQVDEHQHKAEQDAGRREYRIRAYLQWPDVAVGRRQQKGQQHDHCGGAP